RADPRNVDALQGRAEGLFRLGRVAESVRDFDRVVELDPAGLPHNWQRGIALYYAGRFADGARQFERHREVNPQDVENAAFHYACVARAAGLSGGPAEAAKVLIPIDRDPRVPLMKVHELYAGRATAADVLAEARRGDPPADELRERLFYAHYYLALWHEAHGRRAEAADHARLAATDYAVDGYMGDVARVHAWLAAAAAAASDTRPATESATTRPRP
ncbi:MAG: Tetratricopeptide domain protein, partial [Phycisphaerales bacterium]|nr:Tetratricopeptide domain protein [Phycisphaerales bacterium]